MGSGHTVTALYEIVPAGSPMPQTGSVDPLKYQKPAPFACVARAGNELLTVKVRYKAPHGEKSKLLQEVLLPGAKPYQPNAPADFRFSRFRGTVRDAVAQQPAYRQVPATTAAIETGRMAPKGKDPEGYRAEYIQLLKKAQALSASGEGGVTGRKLLDIRKTRRGVCRKQVTRLPETGCRNAWRMGARLPAPHFSNTAAEG